ncbi:MAG: hypothetical protein EA374_05265 [Acholeplasmatales bacterium]|nr:MAG: hypothetical protein EA374_05265 [Acholeplasmatales bacterium]
MKPVRTILEMKPLPKGFFRISIDQGPSTEQHKMHQETVFKHRLSTGQMLEERAWKKLLEDDAYFTLLDYALARIAERDYTKKSLKEKLTLRKAKPSVITRVIKQLEDMAVLDEARTLDRMREDFLQGPPKGGKLLKQQLLKAGFDVETVKATLEGIDPAVWAERCEAYCQSLLTRYKHETHLARKRKMMTAAYTKGFDQEMVETAVDIVLKRATPVDEEALLATRFKQLKDRYNLKDAKTRNALIRTLLRQGFAYSAIIKMIESEGNV